MALRTVGELTDGVAGLLSGTNIDKVTGLYKVFERAARKLLQKADIPEAMQKVSVTLYDGVYDYLVSENIFGAELVDVRVQGTSRWYSEDVQKMPIALFDRTKHVLPSGYKVTFEHVDGVPMMRIASSRPLPGIILDRMVEADDWTGGGSLSGLVEDNTVYYEEPASLRFTLTGSSTGTLTRTLDNTLDLETYEDVGVAFVALRIPDGATATNLTGMELRIGSSDSAYDSVSETEGFLGAWTAGKWIIVAFDLSTSSSTGTPDWTAIDYVQVRMTHTGTFTNMRLGGVWVSLPSPHDVLFQSSAIFVSNSTGLRTKTIVSDNDTVVLNDAAYLLYEHECALGIAVQNKQEKQAQTLRSILYGGEDKSGLYDEYRGDNPSNTVRTVGQYYE